MGCCPIHESLNKASRSLNLRSWIFFFFFYNRFGGSIWIQRKTSNGFGDNKKHKRDTLEPFEFSVLLAISKGHTVSSSWFWALLSPCQAPDLVGSLSCRLLPVPDSMLRSAGSRDCSSPSGQNPYPCLNLRFHAGGGSFQSSPFVWGLLA